MEFHKPHPLKPKDKIAVVSPSSGMPFLFPWVYEQGLRRLKEVFELEPVEFSTARKSPEFLSQNPKARADDINRAFADPSIKGIIATIGGNDQVKILPFLDKKIIQANPKIFMGYSDNTNLHLVLWIDYCAAEGGLGRRTRPLAGLRPVRQTVCLRLGRWHLRSGSARRRCAVPARDHRRHR